MDYSEGFRASMVRRMTGPGKVSANVLSKEVGISQPTLSRWLRAAASVPKVSTKKSTPRAKTWTVTEKLRVVLAADGLNDEELGALLRTEGIHSAQLEEWRKAAEAAFSQRTASKAEAALERQLKELRGELLRKDRARAEAAARLLLRKKAEALWGVADDEAESTSDERSSPQSRKR